MDNKWRMYEMTYILTSVLTTDQIKEVVSRITAAVENAGGVIKQVDQWGMKRLAYPVAKKRNGYYVNLYFEGAGGMVARIERLLTIDDHVLRYLTLAMDKQMLAAYERHKSKASVQENSSEEGAAEEPQPIVETSGATIPRGPRYIDYKETEFLQRFVNEQGKILPRRVTDVSAKRQRAITRAIKRARHLALMPFVADSVR